MARPRKNEAEMTENEGYLPPKSVEMGTESDGPAVKEYKFWEDPYLTDEQRDLLISHEMKKLLASVKVNMNESVETSTLIRFVTEGVQTEYVYYLINVVGSNIEQAWEFYSRHIKDATPSGFLRKLTETLGVSNVKYRKVTLMDLE